MGGVDPSIQRGISFGGARFAFNYGTVTLAPGVVQTVVRVWCGLIVAPVSSSGVLAGSPLSFPVLGAGAGDANDGVRILWRTLLNVSCTGDQAPSVAYAFNENFYRTDGNRVWQCKSKAFLREGMGLFWVTELVTGLTDATGLVISNDLTMSLAVRSVR